MQPPRIRDFIGKPRNSKTESELAERLRELPGDEAFDFIAEYIDHDPVVGLALAKRVLKARDQFRELLRRGFVAADASSIRFWLECCVERLGPARVLALLREAESVDHEAAKRAFYWTRIVVSRAMPALVDELDAMERELKLQT